MCPGIPDAFLIWAVLSRLCFGFLWWLPDAEEGWGWLAPSFRSLFYFAFVVGWEPFIGVVKRATLRNFKENFMG